MTRICAFCPCSPSTQVQVSQSRSLGSECWAILPVCGTESHGVRLRDKGRQADNHGHWPKSPSVSSPVDIRFSLSLSTVDIWVQSLPCWGRGCCLVHCTRFSCIPSLYSLDTSNPPTTHFWLAVTTKMPLGKGPLRAKSPSFGLKNPNLRL